MKKSAKIIFIILIILLSIILIDTIQAKLFNNRPVLKITKSYNGGNVLQKDNGVFVYTYNFSNGRKKTVFRWEKYAPPLEKSSDVQDENANNITWEEITENGVNEEILINNLDTELLTQIAKKLQSLVEQETEDETKNPNIVLTEGWTRVFQNSKYQEVINIGNPAIKPLFFILYKSENNGLYEYICAKALQDISGIGNELNEDGSQKWTNAKDYLKLFIKEIK